MPSLSAKGSHTMRPCKGNRQFPGLCAHSNVQRGIDTLTEFFHCSLYSTSEIVISERHQFREQISELTVPLKRREWVQRARVQLAEGDVQPARPQLRLLQV